MIAPPQPCFKCGAPVRAVGVDPAEHGASFAAHIPHEADERIMWRQVEIGVCAPCLIEAGNAGRVLQRTILRPPGTVADDLDAAWFDEVHWPAEERFEAIVRGLAASGTPEEMSERRRIARRPRKSREYDENARTCVSHLWSEDWDSPEDAAYDEEGP